MTNKSKTSSVVQINYKPVLVSLILFFSDILAILLSYGISYAIRYLLIPLLGELLDISTIYPILWLSLLLIVGFFILNAFYPATGRTGITEMKEIIRLVTIAYITLGLAVFFMRFGSLVSRSVLIISWVLTIFLISSFRLFIHNRFSLLSWWSQPLLIVGYEKDVDNVIVRLQHARRMALKPVVALILNKGYLPSNSNGIPYLPYSKELQKQIRADGVQQALFVNHTMELKSSEKEELYKLSLSFPHLIYVMSESPLSSLSMKTFDLEGRPALRVQYNLLDPWSRRFKRFFDLVISVLSLIITLPLFLVFALMIRLDSPGPIIFTQNRMGRNGDIFKLYKFRTMQIDAEKRLDALLKSDENIRKEYLLYHKIVDDPRITRVGRLLRKLSMDEFPQIINIFKGDMSIVGPRAYLPQEKEQMGEYAALIHRVRPGLTGWWQVMGRHDLPFKERLKLDEYYISNFSIWMDFYIMIKTVWVVISGKGA